MDSKTLRIALVIVVILIVVALLALAGRSRGSRGDHYLVYPYLDLDEPGERGSYYALSEGCP
jgi:hypothetical protein